MKRDEIKAIFPDATDDQLDRTMNLYGASVNGLRTELNTANGELTALKGKGDIDDIIRERDEWKTKATDYEANAAKAQAEAKLNQRFTAVTGDRKYVNDFTKSGILGEFKAAIEKPENQGKSDSDIFRVIIKDRAGIFENARQQPNIPGAGIVEQPSDAKSYIDGKYKNNPFYKG